MNCTNCNIEIIDNMGKFFKKERTFTVKSFRWEGAGDVHWKTGQHFEFCSKECLTDFFVNKDKSPDPTPIHYERL